MLALMALLLDLMQPRASAVRSGNRWSTWVVDRSSNIDELLTRIEDIYFSPKLARAKSAMLHLPSSLRLSFPPMHLFIPLPYIMSLPSPSSQQLSLLRQAFKQCRVERSQRRRYAAAAAPVLYPSLQNYPPPKPGFRPSQATQQNRELIRVIALLRMASSDESTRLRARPP